MKRELIIFLAICAFSAAFVARERRALNTEDEEHKASSSSPATKQFCAPQTPCAWSIYKPIIKLIEGIIHNTYCDCEPGLACVIDEDDVMVSSYVHRCRTPQPEPAEDKEEGS